MSPLTRREWLTWGAAGAALGGVSLSSQEARADSQPPGPLRKRLDLVFEGGGVKGMAFAGAIGVLERSGYSFRRLIGSSAGALAATCLALGYDADGLQQLLTTHHFDELLHPPAELKGGAIAKSITAAIKLKEIVSAPAAESPPAASPKVLRGISAFMETGAFADEKPLLEFVGKCLDGSKIERDVTLGEFHRKRLAGRMRQLSLIASDVTAQRLLVLNERTAPDVPLVEAVRMSMGIPFVWPEKEWKRDWGETYRTGTMWDEKEGGHLVVDGGVLSNFPLRFLLDVSHAAAEGVLGPLAGEASPLGLLLDEALPNDQEAIEGVEPRKHRAWMGSQLPPVKTALRVLNTMLGAWDAEAIGHAEHSVCRIPVKGISMLRFDITDSEKDALFASGGKAMEAYLASRAAVAP